MDTIIAGRFEGFDAAEEAPGRLEDGGFHPSSVRVVVELQRRGALRRPLRVTVAVRVDAPGRDDDAIRLLKAAGATAVDRLTGEWSGTHWRSAEDDVAWRSLPALLQPISVRRHLMG